MRRLLALAPLAVLLAASGWATTAKAQSEGLLQPEDDVHLFLERQRVLGAVSDPELGARPLSTYRAYAILDSLARRDSLARLADPDQATALSDPSAPAPPRRRELLSPLDRARLARLRGETTAGVFGPAVASRTRLYQDGRSFARAAGQVPGGADYALEVEPLLFLEGGPGRQTEVGDADPSPFVYSAARGLRVAARLGRVFADARVEETQRRVPLGDAGRRSAPRLGFTVFPDGRGVAPVYDYLNTTGMVGYIGPSFEARFGRDRNRWGLGRESTFLTDYAAPYDQLQLRFRVWRLAFQSLYARSVELPPSDGLAPSRYIAAHRAALDLGRGVEIEAFETVAFATDTTDQGRRGGFELAYLNPIQFYRGTERDIGSPDNVLLGAGIAWRPTGGVRLYAQGLLDELVSSAFFEDDWRNKWGFVTGVDLSDPGAPGLGRVQGLDVTVEYARLRPYLYAHRVRESAFTNLGDVLGHPAGPNASDLTVSARYRPLPDWEASVDVVRTVRGRNTEEENFGSDPTRSNRDRVRDTGVTTLQGIRQAEWLVEAQAGVRLLPNATAGLALRAPVRRRRARRGPPLRRAAGLLAVGPPLPQRPVLGRVKRADGPSTGGTLSEGVWGVWGCGSGEAPPPAGPRAPSGFGIRRRLRPLRQLRPRLAASRQSASRGGSRRGRAGRRAPASPGGSCR